jgi:hypothetical protein
MTKPRLLIPVSLQFSVRYLLRTGLLSQIEDFAQPVLLLGWKDDALEKELGQEGYEVHSLPKAKWGAQYERTRAIVNLWHQQHRNSPSTAIRDRRQNLDRPVSQRLRKSLRQTARAAILSIPGGPGWMQKRESELFWTDTNAREIEEQFQRWKIDAVFCVTPFLTDEEMTVRVAALSGVPSATAILSFDNLTTRPWIPITFDVYLLWNRHNAEQLRRGYPQTVERDVKIVGSPQFDFYWKPEFLWNEEEWRRRLALPVDRPVLLFAGGYFTCAPHEPQFLGQLDDAIEANEIPGKPVILFRRHPVDPIERWQGVLQRAKHIVLDNPWQLGAQVLGHTNIGTDDIRKLASTLCHSGVHVNVASTMTIDGAIFDKYQVGPAYDDSPSRKYDRVALECYYQEHFLPITQSNGIAIARSRQDLIRAVRAGFTDPREMHEGRRRIVQEMCTFDDGKCAQRVGLAVREFVGASVPRPAAVMPSPL